MSEHDPDDPNDPNDPRDLRDPSDPDSDAKQLAALGRDLPHVDVDATTGEQIARRARMDVGRGAPKRRWILPIIAVTVSLGYLTWTLLRVFEVLG